MPAGAGTPSYKKRGLVVGDVWVPFAPPSAPWIPAPFRATGQAFA